MPWSLRSLHRPRDKACGHDPVGPVLPCLGPNCPPACQHSQDLSVSSLGPGAVSHLWRTALASLSTLLSARSRIRTLVGSALAPAPATHRTGRLRRRQAASSATCNGPACGAKPQLGARCGTR